MIEIEKLTKEDIGRNVIYTNGIGEKEYGYITSFNDKYIFVDYGNSCGRGIATSSRDLDFEYNKKNYDILEKI